MRGRVLGYDTTAQATVVRGEDDQRYRFSAFEWREASPPRKGDEVDFEPDGVRGRDVYRTKAAPLDAIVARPASPSSEASGDTPAQMLLRQPLVRFLVSRPVFATALLVLIACLFSAYAIDGARLSLFAAPDLAWRMSTAINGLLASSGPDPGPRLAGAAARIATVFLLCLYIVPALAAYVAWREFVGRPDLRIARLAGIAAMSLPLALPGMVVLIVQAGVLPGLPELPLRLGRDGLYSPSHAFHPVQLYAGGTIVIVLAGLALWAAAKGRLAAWIASAMIVQGRPEAKSTEVAEDRAADFRPRRARRPAAAGVAADSAPQQRSRPGEPALPTSPPGDMVGLEPAQSPPPQEERFAPAGDGPLRRAGAAVAASSQDAMAALSERLRRAITGEGHRGGAERIEASTQQAGDPQPRLRDVLRQSPPPPSSTPPNAAPTEPRPTPLRASGDSKPRNDH